MPVLLMALLELRRRSQGALLCLLLVVSAVATLTAVWTLRDATTQRVRRVTAQIGNNLIFLPAEADPGAYFAVIGDQPLLDDTLPDRLYQHPVTGHHGTHYVARLQERVRIGSAEAILTGFRVVRGGHRPGEDTSRRRSFLDDHLPAGSVLVGSEIARRLGVSDGDLIEIQGQRFGIHRVIHELGDLDDLRIWGNLSEIQPVLGLTGYVHAVDALGCWGDGSYLPPIRQAVETDPSLDGLRLLHTDQIARTRIRTRIAVERVGALAALIVAVLAALGLFATTLFEVRTRRGEIGIMSALGAGAGRIALLFAPKALMIGLLGGLLGWGLGTGLAIRLGPALHTGLEGLVFRPQSLLLGYCMLGAAGLTLLVQELAVWHGTWRDPVWALKEL